MEQAGVLHAGFPIWILTVPNGVRRQRLKWETETAVHPGKLAAG